MEVEHLFNTIVEFVCLTAGYLKKSHFSDVFVDVGPGSKRTCQDLTADLDPDTG